MIEPHLLSLFINLPIAKDIWDSVNQTFYNGADDSQYYELRCKGTRTKQNGQLIYLYYIELNSVWQEMDRRRSIKMAWTTNLHVRHEEIQKDRICDFFAGLDEIFDSIRSDLLQMKPVLGIEECFNMV